MKRERRGEREGGGGGGGGGRERERERGGKLCENHSTDMSYNVAHFGLCPCRESHRADASHSLKEYIQCTLNMGCVEKRRKWHLLRTLER